MPLHTASASTHPFPVPPIISGSDPPIRLPCVPVPTKPSRGLFPACFWLESHTGHQTVVDSPPPHLPNVSWSTELLLTAVLLKQKLAAAAPRTGESVLCHSSPIVQKLSLRYVFKGFFNSAGTRVVGQGAACAPGAKTTGAQCNLACFLQVCLAAKGPAPEAQAQWVCGASLFPTGVTAEQGSAGCMGPGPWLPVTAGSSC